ncbi:MAG: hypothetical protein OEV92_11090, partial [Nitrospinota bacterium]|nr:hypothetical protein [Nitrospinota bacterium]
TVIIPEENRRELSEVSDTVKKQLHIITVDHMDQALGPALERPLRRRRGSGPVEAKTGVANRGQAALN